MFLTYFDKVKYLLTGLLRSESDAEELGISKKTGKQIKNRISFCVNDCKILAIRFEKVSQNVLRFIRYDFLRNKIP